MDMGSLLGTIFETILNYKRDPLSTVEGPAEKPFLSMSRLYHVHSCVAIYSL